MLLYRHKALLPSECLLVTELPVEWDKKTKKRSCNSFAFCLFALYRARYLAGTQATGAGVDVLGSPIHNRFDTFHVGLKGSVGTSVRVRHLNSELNALTADFAFCHSLHLLFP